MTPRVMAWTGLAFGAGATHAGALWRSAQTLRPSRWSGAWRLPLTGALFLSAVFGREIVPALIGWGGGLLIATVVLTARTRTWK